MKQQELVSAVETLNSLKHHYSSQYEEYMAKALAAKAHIERLEILIKDLSSEQSQVFDNSASGGNRHEDLSKSNASSTQIELDLMTAPRNDDTENIEIIDEKTDNKDISNKEFLNLSSQVMPILESIFTLERGKKLHISYLHKAVNQKSLLGLSQEKVKTFLDKAIYLGYCERDIYDTDCYFSVPNKSDLSDIPSTNNPYKTTLDSEVTSKDVDLNQKQEEQQKEKKYVVFSKTKPNHNLPPSPYVKMNLLETIEGYISECQPKTFTNQDVLNYLYSEQQQEQWTDNQRKDNFLCLKNALNYYYKQGHWNRVKIGLYRPIYN